MTLQRYWAAPLAWVSLVAAGLLLAACGSSQNDSVVPIYDSAPVERRDIEVTVDAAGVIEPITTVEVKSKASGEILSVHADTGDIVEANTLLVEIDKRTPRNRLSEAEAGLEAAKARQQIAQTAMKRSETLFKSGTLTQQDYEQAELEFANAKAQVVSAQVEVENSRIAMDDTEVRAPIKGTIIERQAEPGAVISSPTQAVSDGTILMKMADLGTVQVRTLVDETDIGKIRPGMKTHVTVAAYPNQPFDGEVLKVEPQAIVEQNVTMFAVLIRLDNSARLLMPGMNADVSIQIAKRDDVLAVPTAALRAMSDVPATAAMLGMPEQALQAALDGEASGGHPATGGSRQGSSKNGGSSAKGGTITVRGRTVELPPGVDAGRVQELMAKARSGGDLSAEDRQLIRKVMGQAFGGEGGSGSQFSGDRSGGFSGGGPPPGFSGGPPPGGSGPSDAMPFGGGNNGGGRSRAGVTEYQFGGDYWVVALEDNQPAPKLVTTGLTDLEYSEVLAGLGPEDRVLLLPSTSLFEQQAQLQQFISQRFSSGPFQQQQGGRGPPR
jgi:HlyD family secretion protein